MLLEDPAMRQSGLHRAIWLDRSRLPAHCPDRCPAACMDAAANFGPSTSSCDGIGPVGSGSMRTASVLRVRAMPITVTSLVGWGGR